MSTAEFIIGVRHRVVIAGVQEELLIIGLCILLRVYQPIYIETSVRNKCILYFMARRLLKLTRLRHFPLYVLKQRIR
jgi:hypothetical protein